MPFIASIPDDSGPEGILNQFPESGRLILEFTEKLLRGPSSLTTGERELIAAFTSGLNACKFCTEGHSATAEAFGVEKGLIDSLVEDIETAECEENIKTLLRYVKKLTEEPAKITQTDVEAVFKAGWDEDAFYHAVSICGLFNYYNRLVDAYGLTLAPEFRGLVGEHLAKEGYLSEHTV